jgi:acetyl-CoA synthetase
MSAAPLSRLLNPRSVALFGSGDWTDAVAAGAARIGYSGKVWRVHPRRISTAATTYYRSAAELPGAPDCVFLAVPAQDVPETVRALAQRGTGALVCFSSGFAETGTERGTALSLELQRAAGSIPYIGPNCYGMVNFFDRVALWPDQVVGSTPERGVALICQSGTIALTLMFNDRSLPIGYLISVGNQQRLAAEDLIEALSADPRVTAIGLYIEGIKDAARFAAAARVARERRKPIALIKTGRSAAAARTAHSHTGALTGSDSVFDSFCLQAGIARCNTLAELCETLKLFHAGGPLSGRRVIIMGASGGDMAMTADLAEPLKLEFPPLPECTAAPLRALLGERVTIANPFDMHTYTWFDHSAMRSIFEHVLSADVDAVALMLDCPPVGADDSAWVPVIDEFIAASADAKPRAAMLASLPETLNQRIRERCIAGGVVPMQGLSESLQALSHGASVAAAWQQPFPEVAPVPKRVAASHELGEHAAKRRLAAHGLKVPAAVVVPAAKAAAAAESLGFPVAIKIADAGVAHKSERGGVRLGIRSREAATRAAEELGALSAELLVETMVEGGIAEMLVGIVSDAQFGQVLVLGSGGIQAEVWKDTTRLLPPWTADNVESALRRLTCWPLLDGFRGKRPADVPALVAAILAVTSYAQKHRDSLLEMEINPLIVLERGRGAVAVDALLLELDSANPKETGDA